MITSSKLYRRLGENILVSEKIPFSGNHDAAGESDVSLELSSTTETVESFSTNYVPESEVLALFGRGSTGEPRECPPASNQDLSPDLLLQSSGSGGAKFSIASFYSVRV